MNVLIEFYDAEEPILNLLSCLVLKPDKCIFAGGEGLRKQRNQRSLRNALEMAGLDIELEFVPMDVHDFGALSRALEALVDRCSGEKCILDVTGGNDLLLLAAGFCCAGRNVEVVSHRMGANCVSRLTGERAGALESYDIRLNVAQALALAGGELLRHGHVDPAQMDDGVLELIPRIFEVYRANRQKWPRFVTYLQQTDDSRFWVTDETDIRAPRKFIVNGYTVEADLGILAELADVKVVDDIRLNSSEVAFRYTSRRIGEYLRDVGVWLELYLYASMVTSGLFDNVDVNAVVSWDDTDEQLDTINEIDLIATAGIGRLFISCKTAAPDNAALNEIATLARRFGGRYATAVLATMCDLKTESPAVFRRAVEMGIVVIDADDLDPEALAKKLKTIRRRWDQ